MFLISRFFILWLMGFVRSSVLLTAMALGGTALSLYAVLDPTLPGIWAIVAISTSLSLIFPTNYGIALHGLGEDIKFGAAGLVMAILGGARCRWFTAQPWTPTAPRLLTSCRRSAPCSSLGAASSTSPRSRALPQRRPCGEAGSPPPAEAGRRSQEAHASHARVIGGVWRSGEAEEAPVRAHRASRHRLAGILRPPPGILLLPRRFGREAVILDCCGASVGRLIEAGHATEGVCRLVLSHLHSDHMMEYVAGMPARRT